MKETWRWFGPDDPVSLKDIRQAGAEAIITSLHHIPNGEVWTRKEIKKRIDLLAEAKFNWEVVESLPVHESIKTGTEDRDTYISNYKQSLENLAAEGIDHVVYNFMALTDWTRTDLQYRDKDDALTIRFDYIDLVAFDMFILKRAILKDEYSSLITETAKDRYKSMSDEYRNDLSSIVLMGLPGTVEDLTIDQFREKLAVYHKLGKNGMRKNLQYFLEKIIPLAEKLGITMSIHADDPPFSILGLPRIVSNRQDLEYLTAIEKSGSNALCFCTGTLGASASNNVPELLDLFASRISLVHLRNVKLEEDGSFFESKLFEGSLDMLSIARKLSEEQKRRGSEHPIPFRPDHGQAILNDSERNSYPGYSLYGRLKSLAELRGLFHAISNL